jgi:hypothetical protein
MAHPSGCIEEGIKNGGSENCRITSSSSGHGRAAPLGDLLIKLRDEKKISEEVFNKVAGENAVRVLGL